MYGKDQDHDFSDIPFPDIVGGSSTPHITCSGKDTVDMDSSAEQMTSAGLMAMSGKTPAPFKEKKQQTKGGSADKFEEMAVEISSPDCSMLAFKCIVEIKAKNVKKLMGRKLTSETSSVLMTQIGLAGCALLSADISNDSFFLSVAKQMDYSLENPTNLCKQLLANLSDWLAVNRYIFAEVNYLFTLRSVSFFTDAIVMDY